MALFIDDIIIFDQKRWPQYMALSGVPISITIEWDEWNDVKIFEVESNRTEPKKRHA